MEARAITMEVEAHEDGYLARILQPEGSSPPIGSPIALVCEEEEQVSALSAVAVDMSAPGCGASAHCQPPTLHWSVTGDDSFFNAPVSRPDPLRCEQCTVVYGGYIYYHR